MSKWNDGLNKDQLDAANTLEGPVLILAGAGSGKTKTMTSRICHMIEDGISPGHILAITFTNKAAKEMKERLLQMLGKDEDDDESTPFVSTFHSFGYKLLRKYGSALGYRKNLSICDDEDTMKTIKKLTEEHIYASDLAGAKSDIEIRTIKSRIKDDSKFFSSYISKCKDRLLKPGDDRDELRGIFVMISEESLDKFLLIYEKYEEYLKKNNLVDFDDLIEKCVYLLRNKDIKEHVNNMYTYINVDEYQDTSRAQFELVKLLAGDKQNICVVGDDYQSIYAFRGAVIDNILKFPDYFTGCKKFVLRANYRSTSNIVDGAAAVINNNKSQFCKSLYADRGPGEKIKILGAESGRAESYYIANTIEELVRRGNQYSDIAVLYRVNSQSRTIEDALLKKSIPYTIYGGVGFYERKEIKDIIAYLKLVAGYDDIIAFERIANVPARGLGKKTLDEIVKELEKRDTGKSLVNALCDIKTSKPKITAFYDLIEKLQSADKSLTLVEFIREMLDLTGIKSYYTDQVESATKKGDDEKAEAAREKLANVTEFVSKAAEFMRDYKPDPLNLDKTVLESFLEEVSLYTDTDKNEQANTVSLMTMHKSKGLEFKIVFLAAQDVKHDILDVDDESFFDEEDKGEFQIEEERRLFYVGMTRAKDILNISYAGERYIYGELAITQPVRYIEEIPPVNSEYIY